MKGVVFEDLDLSGSMDEGESLLDGVTAHLTLNTGGAPGFTPASSAGDGAFGFTGLAPGTYTLSFTGIPAGWQIATPDGATVSEGSASAVFSRSAGAWVITVRSDAESIYVETGLVKMSAISGYVWKDHDNNWVKGPSEAFYDGLTVTLYTDWDEGSGSGTYLSDATTGPNGAYEFGDLYLGEYAVVLTLPANWHVTYPGEDVMSNAPTHAVMLSGVEPATDLNFGVTQLISLSGRVWEDTEIPANGSYDAGDAPVAGAVVAITGPYKYSSSTLTGPDGTYSFVGLLLGAYTVTLADDRLADRHLSNAFAGAVGPPATVSLNTASRSWSVESHVGHDQGGLDFALAGATMLKGKVWEDTDGDGAYQSGEPLMGGHAVVVFHDDGKGGGYVQVATLETDSGGAYSYAVTEPGLYRVSVTPPTPASNWAFTYGTDGVAVMSVAGLGETHVADFGMARYASVSGLVWLELDGDGLYAAGGVGETPIHGHYVTVYRNGVQVRTAEPTATDGRYGFDLLIPGDYVVTFEAVPGHLVTNAGDGFDPSTRTWSMTILSGDVKGGLDFGFTPERAITGAIWADDEADGVWGAGEDAMGGIQVRLLVYDGTGYVGAPAYPAPVLTGPSGEFGFTGLPPGQYRVAVLGMEAYICTNPSAPQTAEDRALDYGFGAADTLLTLHREMGLVLPVSLSGLTFIDKDSSGSYEPHADAPCSVKVTVERLAPQPSAYAWFVTDGLTGLFDSGSALGLRLPPGTYKVTFEPMADHTVSTDGTGFDANTISYTVTLGPGKARDDLEVGYKAAYLITGYVWKDLNYDGAAGAEEPHFTDGDSIWVTVTADAGGHGPYASAVGDDGRFAVEVDGPGAYTLVVTGLPAGYLITSKDPSYDADADAYGVALSYEVRAAHLEIGTMLYVGVSGMLWMDGDADGMPGESEGPIAGALVRLIGADGGTVAEALTDGYGAYSFAKVPLGTYAVELADPPTAKSFYTGYGGPDAPGPAVSSFDPRTGVWTLIVGEDGVDNANSGYCEPSEVSGVVQGLSGDGGVVAGLAVELHKKGESGAYEPWLSSTTDAGGAYHFGALLPGEYKVTIEAPAGYQVTQGSAGAVVGDVIVIEMAIGGLGDEWEGLTSIYLPETPIVGPPGGQTDPNGGGGQDGGGGLAGGDGQGGDDKDNDGGPLGEEEGTGDGDAAEKGGGGQDGDVGEGESDVPYGGVGDDDFFPGGWQTADPPVTEIVGNVLVPTDEGGVYMELDEYGIPFGLWRWDEESGVWVFERIMDGADGLPFTGVGAFPICLALLFGCSVAGLGITLMPVGPLRPRRRTGKG
ncbi:MAG: hypothetical protein FWE70_01715 [Oscillospiraceae bacterium]|nr:hypothetical protein [Oscillospiraceae bacterium]